MRWKWRLGGQNTETSRSAPEWPNFSNISLNDLFKLIKDHFYVLGSTLPDITGDSDLDFHDSVVALKYVVLPLASLQSQGPQSVKS